MWRSEAWFCCFYTHTHTHIYFSLIRRPLTCFGDDQNSILMKKSDMPRIRVAGEITTGSRDRKRGESAKFGRNLGRDILCVLIRSTLEGLMNKRMTLREMEYLLHKESAGINGRAVECCPETVDMVEPVGGRNRRNMFVQLFRNGDITQRFFEYSCREDVLDRPCKFIDWRLSNRSKCVQKFAYVYAIVNTTSEQVRSRAIRNSLL